MTDEVLVVNKPPSIPVHPGGDYRVSICVCVCVCVCVCQSLAIKSDESLSFVAKIEA